MTPGFLFNRQRAIQDVVVFADYVLDAPKPQDDSTEAPRPFRPTLHYSPITRQLEIQHLTIVFPVRPPPHFIFEDYNVAFDLSIPEFLANLKTLTLVFKPLELDIAHDSLRNFVWGRTSVIQFLSWILQSPLLPHIRITVIGLETVFPDMANKEADVESFRNDIVAGVYDERVSPPPSKPDCHLELITYQQYCERSHVVDAAVHTWKTIPTLGVEYVPGEQWNLIAQMMERFHKDLL
jgi:hypothetical protein